MWSLIYLTPMNSLVSFAVDLYGEKVSEYLYKLPPNHYLIKLNNEYLSYGASIYSDHGEVGFESFSSLVDPSTFRFVREEKNGMIYVFEDKGYVYEYFFEAETRFCATIKEVRK